MIKRRDFLKQLGQYSIGLGSVTLVNKSAVGFFRTFLEEEPLFKISLAEWSLNKSIFGGKIDHLDFAKIAKNDFGIDALEYVNQFFFEKAKDQEYLQDGPSSQDPKAFQTPRVSPARTPEGQDRERKKKETSRKQRPSCGSRGGVSLFPSG